METEEKVKKIKKKIKLYTSLSPVPADLDKQRSAVNSWKEFDVHSINCKEEVEVLQEHFKDVKFIKTEKTAMLMFGKPLPLISVFFDEMKKHKDDRFILINSDIVYLPCKKEYVYETKTTTVFHRYDFVDGSDKKPVMYDQGLDMFLIMKQDLKHFPPSLLCIGRCHFDWAIPFHLIRSKVKVFRAMSPYIYHQKHKQNYTGADWRKTCELLMLECGVNVQHKTLQQFNNYVFSVLNIQTRRI